MKTSYSRLTLLPLSLALAAPVFAQGASAPPAPVPAAAPATTVLTAPDWLADKGILTTDAVLDALRVDATPEQRAKLETALAQRNGALTVANAQLSAQLKSILAADDTKLAQVAVAKDKEDDEARRMEKMKRLQPMRYQEILREQQAAEAKAAAATAAAAAAAKNPSAPASN